MNSVDNPKFTILLADDGSEHARSAVDLIADLKFPGTSKVQIIRVITPLQAAEHVNYEESLNKTCEALSSRGINISSEMILGYPAEKIIEYSDSLKPDLIILGAKGLRSTLGILLGGVAQQVVEYACCPVLIVRAPYRGLSRIVIASDGSDSSFAAVDFFGKLPRIKKTSIDIVHVLPPPPIPMTVVEPMFMDLTINQPWEITEEEEERRKKEEEEGNAILSEVGIKLAKFGYGSTPILLRGDAASEIIGHVKSEEVNLIVTGSRGLSNFRSWLMGSVSRKLVHYSDCSVLIVRGSQ